MDTHSVLTDPVLGGIHAAMTAREATVPVHQSSLGVMGAKAHITTVGGTPELPEAIGQLLSHLDDLWSRFRPDSEISRLNNSPETPFDASPETLRLLEEMAWGYSRSKGAFDPTLLPSLLNEGYTHSLVNPELITEIPSSALSRGRMSDIDVDGSQVTLHRGTTVDSGGVGKGLAADIAVEFALNEGALGALVEVGATSASAGYLRALIAGGSLSKTLDTSNRLSVVELRSEGLATSTITKRRFTVGTRHTHHIINPVTKRSAESDTIQASVIASTASQAEMWTKVAFVRGSQDLLTLARTHGFHAACLLRGGEWVTSEGWPESDA